MRVLCCGDRNWTLWEPIWRELTNLPAGAVVIHGNCRGADKMCGKAAAELGFEVKPFPADWYRYGKAAGPIRNRQMLLEGRPDLVLAFHEDIAKSKGTKDMVAQAEAAGVEVRVITE